LETELLKLVTGGGGVVACIVVVILFLKNQEKQNDNIKQITEKFSADNAANQKAYQDQITALAAQTYANQKLYQDQIKTMIDDHMSVTRETITAVKSVEATVRSVVDTVRRLESTVSSHLISENKKHA
jgi:hypothetical protein